MASIAAKRIRREFRDAAKSEDVVEGRIKLKLADKSWSNVHAVILGPQETPYEGGRFMLDIKVPDNYPFNPPKMRFMTPIWHPNVSHTTGEICIDVLAEQWAAALTLRGVLTSILSLMSAPEPDDPKDPVVAKQFRDKRKIFNDSARHWTNVYAEGPFEVPECEVKLARLVDMGLNTEVVRVALSVANWDIEVTTENMFR